MMRLLLILILTINFQSLTKADDIRDFEIEGMSIGDSALNFFSKKDLISNQKLQWYDTEVFTPIAELKLENFRCYDFVEMPIKKGITLIHGRNGSGKSSIIEAIYFTLLLVPNFLNKLVINESTPAS